MTSTTNSPKRIAFIQACWHRDIVDQARDAFVAKVAEPSDHQVDLFEVPGALEAPLQAKLLAKTGKYDAVVAAGLVVDGGIYRHEFVAQAVLNGLMQVQLEMEIPVLSVVLTPHHFHDGEDHKAFFNKHFIHKGAEAGATCVDILAFDGVPIVTR